MEIHKENQEKHSIQSYHDQWIRIANNDYTGSILLTQTQLESPWGTFLDLNLSRIQTLDLSGIELMIIGVVGVQQMITFDIRQYLASQGIGLEIMGLGAACRTFNILIGEQRQVLGLFYLAQ